MENRLREHVEGLFSRYPSSDRACELKEEMILNLTDKYNDLVADGMEPERAYTATVAGIGDIDELLRDEKARKYTHENARESAHNYSDDADEEGRHRGRTALLVGGIVLVAALVTCLVLLWSGGNSEVVGPTPKPTPKLTATPAPTQSTLGDVIGGAIDGVIDGAGALIDGVGGIIDGVVGAVEDIGSVGSKWSDGPFEGEIAMGQVALDASEVKSIGVRWTAGGVRISPYKVTSSGTGEPSDEIVFEQTGANIPENRRLRYTLVDGTLLLHEGDGTPCVNGRATQLTVYIPVSARFDELSVSVASANADLSGTKAGKLTFSGASGELSVANCEVGKTEISTVSGGVKMTGAFENVSADTVSGELTIQSSTMLKSLKTSSVSGDVTLTIPENSGFTAAFDSVSGDFQNDFGGGVYGDGSAKIEASSVSGGLAIRRGR